MDQEEKGLPRVRFGELNAPDEDERFAAHERRHERNLSRRSSIGSLSIRSAGGARTVQPETALPIVYRTLSIEVDERQLQKQAETKKAKEKAAVGDYALEYIAHGTC